METKPQTKKRSVSLSQKMDKDLLALTDALGVNPHSYMVNELAKSIQRDSLNLQMKNNTESQFAELFKSLNQVIKD